MWWIYLYHCSIVQEEFRGVSFRVRLLAVSHGRLGSAYDILDVRALGISKQIFVYAESSADIDDFDGEGTCTAN